MQSAMLDRSDFRDCYMEQIDLRGSSLVNAKMTRANLQAARLSPLQFEDKITGNKTICRVNLSNADLRFANLQDIDLRDALLVGADLTHANLSRADLRRANFTGAILTNTCINDANLKNTIIDKDA